MHVTLRCDTRRKESVFITGVIRNNSGTGRHQGKASEAAEGFDDKHGFDDSFTSERDVLAIND